MNVDIIQAIRDPNLIGDTISDAQEVCLRALYGLDMTRDQAILLNRLKAEQFDSHVGDILPDAPEDDTYEPKDHREAVFVAGRRGGKSDKLAANVSIYEACFRDHRPYLSVGEDAYVLCLSQTMRTKVVFKYILGKLERSPMLSQLLAGQPRAEEIPLNNGITIACYPCSFKAVRGLTVVACINDEIAFWSVEGVNPDGEVLTAVRPGMATIPYARMVTISSPYTKAGELWRGYSEREKDPDTLVLRAPTVVLNPSARAHVERERKRGVDDFEREYLAKFGEGSETFLPHVAIHECIIAGRFELPYRPQYHYRAALDAAFKSERFTFSVGHRNEEKRVVDILRSWEGTRAKPVNMGEVVEEIADLCFRYRVSTVVGDQYCSQPIREALAKKRIHFSETEAAGKTRRKAYLTFKTLINQRQIELLDHAESIKELQNLELRRTAGGVFSVGHPRHGKHTDDFADAIALCVEQMEGVYVHPAYSQADNIAHERWIKEHSDKVTGYLGA